MQPAREPAGTAAMLALLGRLPPATRASMTGMYRDGLAKQLAALEPVLGGGQAPDAGTAKVAHTVAGSAGMMQDTDLSASAHAVEKALVAGDVALARALWPAVREAAQATLAALG